MNFDDIKKEIEEDVSNEEAVTPMIDLNRGKNNPVQMIRSNMKKEIIIQLICIVIIMIYPIVVEMQMLNEAVYYIFMFITCLMTMGYLLKLAFFLKKTSNFTANTKDTINSFIFEAKLTLEVYKSFIIAGSLLLPAPVFSIMTNQGEFKNLIEFERWFLLNLSGLELSLLIVGYLLLAVVFYFSTRSWANLLYGKYLNQLEEIITDLGEE